MPEILLYISSRRLKFSRKVVVLMVLGNLSLLFKKIVAVGEMRFRIPAIAACMSRDVETVAHDFRNSRPGDDVAGSDGMRPEY